MSKTDIAIILFWTGVLSLLTGPIIALAIALIACVGLLFAPVDD